MDAEGNIEYIGRLPDNLGYFIDNRNLTEIYKIGIIQYNTANGEVASFVWDISECHQSFQIKMKWINKENYRLFSFHADEYLSQSDEPFKDVPFLRDLIMNEKNRVK